VTHCSYKKPSVDHRHCTSGQTDCQLST